MLSNLNAKGRIWILLIGLGNFIPFVLVFARTYEVANLAGTAMGATWAWALLRFAQSDFSALFSKSAIKRAKLEGMRRNAAALTAEEDRGTITP